MSATADSLCPNCQASLEPDAVACPACGYPLQGTEKEKAQFIGRQVMKTSKVKNAPQWVKHARYALFASASWMLFSGIVAFAVIQGEEGMYSLVGALFYAVVFIGTALWSRKNPFGGLLSGLIWWLFLIVLEGINDPMSVVSGWLIKVVLFTFIIRGLTVARKVTVKSTSGPDVLDSELGED